MKTDPNDARCVVWALGKCFFFLSSSITLYSTSITTIYYYFTTICPLNKIKSILSNVKTILSIITVITVCFQVRATEIKIPIFLLNSA